MKKITLGLVVILLSASTLQAAIVEPQTTIEPQMYLRDTTDEESLAASSCEEKRDLQEERRPVGTRAESQNQYVAAQEKRALELQQNSDSAESRDAEEELSARGSYYNSHQGAYHQAIGVTFYGDQVTLEDGSVWNVASWDQWKTLNWYTTDTILLMQNKWMFSSYKFMLVNQNTGKEVEVNLGLGPYYSGSYTYWIVSIDYYNEQIILNDGSLWEISFFDSSVINKWLVNDTVIIGINESGSSLRPNILINVNTLNYARGLCLN